MGRKTLLTTLGVIGGAIALTVGSSVGPIKKDCETYQGWRKVDGEIYYAFDPKPLKDRGLQPAKHFPTGNPELKDSLKIGEKYCVEIENPIAPWAPKNIVNVYQNGRRIDPSTQVR